MTARIVGIFFLSAFVAYGMGFGLIESLLGTPDYLSNISANKLQVVIGAILVFLIHSAVVVGIGVVMLPILKQYNKSIAYGYLSSIITANIMLIVGVIFLLLLITLSQEYVTAGAPAASYFQTLGALLIKGNYLAYQIAMATWGLGGLMFCYLLYQSKLIPRFMSVWGFIGYVVFLTGALLEFLGISAGLILSIPGGLFEVFFGVWLIVKGFNSPAIASESVKTDINKG